MLKQKHYEYDNRYLNRFFKLNTAPLLLELKVFPNIKEITESMGAFVATYDCLMGAFVDRNSDKVDVFVVGDGSTPRTGALFACLTKWNINSIDPRLRIKDYPIKRLKLFRSRASELKFVHHKRDYPDVALIICVHSHASLRECIDMLEGYEHVHLVNIPCCVKPDLKIAPNISYTDIGIHSEKQQVEIYLDVTKSIGGVTY